VRRALLALAVLVSVAVAARLHAGLSLRPPHRLVPLRAVLLGAVPADLDAASFAGNVHTTESAIAVALAETRKVLWLDPRSHQSDFRFDGRERGAHCEEYAQLFAAALEHVARLRKLPARASVMRSEARLFGVALPWRGWRTHDWVRVQADGGRTWDVDPTLDDAGLGWDVSGDVRL
jgi:hypothetical protein